MLIPTRGKILSEVLTRERYIKDAKIWICDKIKHEKKDNVALCLGVGDGVKVIRRGDIVHYKEPFAQKLRWEEKNLVFVKAEDVIAGERDGEVIALGSMVIVKLVYADKIKTIVLPDGIKQNVGEYHGEVVSAGVDYPDKLRRGDCIVFSRNEGYRFKTYGSREEMLAVKECWILGRRG